MSRLVSFALLLCISLPIKALANSVKILIVDPTASEAAYQELKSLTNGTVDTAATLPANIGTYDAIFFGLKDTVSTSDQLALATYVAGKGKLFLNGIPKFSPHSDNPLWAEIGLKGVVIFDTYLRVDTALGVDSEFTKGMRHDVTHADPTSFDASGAVGLNGHFIPLLRSKGNYETSLAWRSVDSPGKVVIDWMSFGSTQEFVARTACLYFGLCSLAVNRTPPPHINLSVAISEFQDHSELRLQVPAAAGTTISIFNILGAEVATAQLKTGEASWVIPSLPTGTYFLTARRDEAVTGVRFLAAPK